MSTSNIDKFNEMTVKLFDQLYREFPRTIDISMKELAGNTSDFQERQIYEDGVMFLAREKFITVRLANYSNGMFEGVVLTSKGLSVLNSAPAALETKKTIGETIAGLAKDGAKEAYSTIVELIIKAGLSAS